MWNDRLDEAQAGIKIARRNINNLRYADDTTLIPLHFYERPTLLPIFLNLKESKRIFDFTGKKKDKKEK